MNARKRATNRLMMMIMMPVARPIWQRAVRPLERMNSPLESRKVRLRGLGGPAVEGVPGTGASATGDHRIRVAKRRDY
jgi:hypothetical protein